MTQPPTSNVAQRSDIPWAIDVRCASSSSSPVERLVLELGRALSRYGAPAHRLETVLTWAAERRGLKAQYFIVPTAIFASFGSLGHQRTGFVRVEPGGVHLGKLAELDAVVSAMVHEDRSPETLIRQIQHITDDPGPRPRWVIVPSYGLAALAGVQFFDGGWTELVASSTIGALIGLLAVRFGQGRGRYLMVPGAACIAAGLAQILQYVTGYYHTEVVIASSLLVLLPGLTLTIALAELSTRNLVSGTARLMGAGLVLFELAFGLAFGHYLGDRFAPPIAEKITSVPLPPWTEPIAVVLAAVAFTGIFQARTRDALAILIACMIAFNGAKLSGMLFDTFLSAWASAAFLTLCCNVYARTFDRPAIVPLMPALLLLVPGSIGLKSMTWVLSDEPIRAIDSALQMTLTGIALAVGVVTANVVLRRYRVM